MRTSKDCRGHSHRCIKNPVGKSYWLDTWCAMGDYTDGENIEQGGHANQLTVRKA
jgi:hypothetical protein